MTSKQLARFSAASFFLFFAGAFVLADEDQADSLSGYRFAFDGAAEPFVRGNDLDPERKIPPKLLQKALQYYDSNNSNIKNKAYMSIVDFGRHSSQTRLFIVDMRSGEVWSLHVAHGEGSDPGDRDSWRR